MSTADEESILQLESEIDRAWEALGPFGRNNNLERTLHGQIAELREDLKRALSDRAMGIESPFFYLVTAAGMEETASYLVDDAIEFPEEEWAQRSLRAAEFLYRLSEARLKRPVERHRHEQWHHRIPELVVPKLGTEQAATELAALRQAVGEYLEAEKDTHEEHVALVRLVQMREEWQADGD